MRPPPDRSQGGIAPLVRLVASVDRLKAAAGRLTALAGLSLALASCGSGGGDIAGVDSGGTGSYAVGAIAGFGSVIVNDIRYEDSGAVVLTDDDSPRTPADLKLGMIVEIEGSASTAAPAGSPYARESMASRIRYGAEIVGPLQTVDATRSQIAVLGQTLDITPGTIYGEALAGGLATLAALPAGSVLEIHGHLDPGNGGRYIVTRIDSAAPAGEFLLRGVVREIDPATRRFRIGAAQIDFAAISVDEARAAGIVEGGPARVRLMTVPREDGAWPIVQAQSAAPALPDREEVHIAGAITEFAGTTTFAVNGIPVDASSAIINANGAQLGLGSRIEIGGRIRNGSLVADQVEVEDEVAAVGDVGKRIILSGAVEALAVLRQTFKVRGVTVNFGFGSLTFDGGNLADLRNGIRVEVDGRLSADGATVDAVGIRFGPRRASPSTSPGPSEPANPSNPSNPGEPGSPANPGPPTDPGPPANPGPPTDPGPPSNPGPPTNPGAPTNPGTPTNPGSPTDPSPPANPGTPNNPGPPANPGAPGNPGPTNPSPPTKPGPPADPGPPSNPGPTNPGPPANPGPATDPNLPTDPNTPATRSTAALSAGR